MSIFNDKTLKSVADIAAKIMGESSHGTKPEGEKEKKLAALAHPKDKITHKDVLVGRGVLKKEARENVDEAISNKSMSSQAKTTIKHVDNPSVQDRMDAHDIKPGISGYRDRIDYLKRMKQMGKLKNEEAEQVDESVWDYKNSATAKKTGETTRTGHDIRKTTTGTVYTKRAAEEKPESEEPKSRKKQKLGATSNLMSDEEFKKKHGMSRKNYERMQSGVKIGESFCDMLEAYTEHGLKAFASLKEEPDNEQFTKELKDQIASMSGKKKQPSVAAPATQGVKQMPEEFDGLSIEEIEDFMMSEDFEQLDEISKKTLGDYIKKASHDVATKGAIVRQFSNDAEAKKKEHGGTTGAVRELSAKADKVFNKSWKRRQNMAKAVDRLTKEEAEQLDELSKATLKSYKDKAYDDADRRYQKDASLGRSAGALKQLKAKTNTQNIRSYSGLGQTGSVLAKHHPDLHKQIGHIYDTLQARRKEDMKKFELRHQGIERAEERLSRKPKKVRKEEFELDERTLSEPEMKKREEYVKGMKKKLSSFKDRYGDRAKEVMYAVATKQAKKDA
jgi:hypothetical protein